MKSLAYLGLVAATFALAACNPNSAWTPADVANHTQVQFDKSLVVHPASGISVVDPNAGLTSTPAAAQPEAQPSPTPATIYGTTLLGATPVDNSDELIFSPASTTKLLTSGIALETLGADFTFNQEWSYSLVEGSTSAIANFVWTDDGDPTLGYVAPLAPGFETANTDRLNSMIDQLKSTGITSIRGPIVFRAGDSRDDTPLAPPGITPVDRGYCYGVNLKAFNYNRDCLAKTYSDGGKADVDPDATLRTKFIALLAQKGIAYQPKLTSSATGDRKTLEFHSLDLAHLLFQMNKMSDNQLAESLFRTLAKKSANTGDLLTLGQSVYKKKTAEWMNSTGQPQLATDFNILDGAGLSSFTKGTPLSFAYALKHLAEQNFFSVLWNSLPIAHGDYGTLWNRMSDPSIAGFVRAKTGTLAESGYFSLAGYIPILAQNQVDVEALVPFVIFTQAPPSAESAVHQYQDNLVVQMMKSVNPTVKF